MQAGTSRTTIRPHAAPSGSRAFASTGYLLLNMHVLMEITWMMSTPRKCADLSAGGARSWMQMNVFLGRTLRQDTISRYSAPEVAPGNLGL